MKISSLTRDDYINYIIDTQGYTIEDLKGYTLKGLQEFLKDNFDIEYIDVYNFTY